MAVVGVIACTAVLLDVVALVCFVQYVERFTQLVLADLATLRIQLGEDGSIEDAAYCFVTRAVHDWKVG